MSTPYAGADNWPTPVTILDDGDDASAAIISTADESALDRTTYLRARLTDPKIYALGSLPFQDDTVASPAFQIGDGDYNYRSVHTDDFAGHQAKFVLPVVHGESLYRVEVIFIPKNGHAGLPGTNISISVVRVRIVSGETPAAVSVLGTATYVPVSLADYNNGNFKAVELELDHVVDAENYSYQLVIADEDGANAKPDGVTEGATYLSVRITYAV